MEFQENNQLYIYTPPTCHLWMHCQQKLWIRTTVTSMAPLTEKMAGCNHDRNYFQIRSKSVPCLASIITARCFTSWFFFPCDLQLEYIDRWHVPAPEGSQWIYCRNSTVISINETTVCVLCHIVDENIFAASLEKRANQRVLIGNGNFINIFVTREAILMML